MGDDSPLDRPTHFLPEEVEGLQPRLVAMLDRARTVAGVPFVISSGLRSEAENTAAGGVKNSAHTRGLAVDLQCFDDSHRFRMIRGLIFAGFRRIGGYDRHLHADIDDSLPPDVLWLGTSH